MARTRADRSHQGGGRLKWSIVFGLLTVILAACGQVAPSVPPSSKPRASVASPSLALDVSPRPTPTTVIPPDPALVKLVPADLRSSCVDFDLSDADPEVYCSDGTVDLYLARWPSAKAVRVALKEEIDPQCDLLKVVAGPILAGSKTVGRAWGCIDDPTLEFTNEPGRIQGSVTIDTWSLFDVEQWVREEHPGFSGKPKLAGAAFGPPIGSLPLKALIARAKTVSYKTLARHIEDYADTLVHYRAKVLQVTDDGHWCW